MVLVVGINLSNNIFNEAHDPATTKDRATCQQTVRTQSKSAGSAVTEETLGFETRVNKSLNITGEAEMVNVRVPRDYRVNS